MLRMIQYITEYPMKYVTFYVFSTENWNRPESEVNGLFKLVEHFVGEQLQKIHEKNITHPPHRPVRRITGKPAKSH